jgi:hypothetical protein
MSTDAADGTQVPTQRRKRFVNLPVSDVARAKAFDTALGFSLNPQFSDDETDGVETSSELDVVHCSTERFLSFAPHPAPRPAHRGPSGALLERARLEPWPWRARGRRGPTRPPD